MGAPHKLQEIVVKQHRFSFGDCCVAVTEHFGGSSPYPVLFFLHGRFGHGEIWSPTIDRLLPQFHCFSLDLPGFGRSFSARERGLSLLEHAHLVRTLVPEMLREEETAILVGHDIGGAIAQLSAVDLRERLSGMVLINCQGLAEPVSGIKTGWFGWSARWRLNRLIKESEVLGRALEQILLDPWSLPSTRASLIRALRAFEVSWPGPFERQFWRQQVRNFHFPVLLLWGHRDSMNRSEIGLRMVRELEEAYFFERETSGHWPTLDAPEWVSIKIREFAFRAGGHAKEISLGLRKKALG